MFLPKEYTVVTCTFNVAAIMLSTQNELFSKQHTNHSNVANIDTRDMNM